MKQLLLLCVALCTGTAQADGYTCRGEVPQWQMQFDDSQARFHFPSPTTMDVMLVTRPQDKNWPLAITMVGDRDTAIVLLERETCGAFPYRAHVMTQRGQTPILLTGCCADAE